MCYIYKLVILNILQYKMLVRIRIVGSVHYMSFRYTWIHYRDVSL